MTTADNYCKLAIVLNQTFAERFTAARERIPGMNKYQLAKRSGISEATLSRIENGHTIPSDETLELLAPFFDVSLGDLVEWARIARAAKVRKREDIGGPDFDAVIAAGVAGPHPITQDERDAIDECAALGVWTSEIEGSDLWAIPVDDERRRSVFAYLAELAELARNHARRAL